jgi:CheY-like chemotaxis protein
MEVELGRFTGRRVVVTDENSGKLSAITDTLRQAGLRVFAAYDGQSALELVTQLGNIDLLVTNTRLGAISGPELMRRSRELHPSMPILHIVHDGGSDTSLFSDVMNLLEPFTDEQLVMVVRTLLH